MAAASIVAMPVSNALSQVWQYVEVVTFVCVPEGELQTADTANMGLIPVKACCLCAADDPTDTTAQPHVCGPSR